MQILHRSLNNEAIQKDYKKVAWFYNIWASLTESRATAYILQRNEICDGASILEVACGTGVLFQKIVERNPNGKNIGIDLSPAMLNKAMKRLKKNKMQNYELLRGDVFKLDFPEQSFDIIINSFMIDLMPQDQFDTIASIFFRLLKPGGMAAIAIFSHGEKFVNRFWSGVARVAPALLTGCRPVDFIPSLLRAGFRIDEKKEISQNTFPSQVICAIRP